VYTVREYKTKCLLILTNFCKTAAPFLSCEDLVFIDITCLYERLYTLLIAIVLYIFHLVRGEMAIIVNIQVGKLPGNGL
jgi:hypothetical protein